MGRGDTGLDNKEYDQWLAENKKERELIERRTERKMAHNSQGVGWHFGIDSKPVYVKDKEEFRRELNKRGLAIADEAKRRK
jgi:hypothetical protein